MKRKKLVFLSLVFAGFYLSGEETGKPFMSLYPAMQTGGHTQNWAFAQDDRGIMYIGNGYGVQEFDGSAWRMIRIPNGSFVRSFARDSSGSVFVGSATELGYLQVNSSGSLQYISLLDQIPPADRNFNFIWSVHVTPEGVFFQARERLFLFQRLPSVGDAPVNWRVKIWRAEIPENYFVHSFYHGQTLFVLKRGTGLMKMTGDSLRIIPGSQQFGNDRIHVMLPFPGQKNNFLLGTLNRGLFLYDGVTFQPFRTEADELLLQGALYDGKVLPDGLIALGTLSRGFIIIDTAGKIKLHLLKESGLISNAVTSIFTDRQNNIWLGMSGGISILEYQSGLLQFPFSSGGVPFDIYRHQGILYASATDGVYYLDKEDSQFRYVPGMKNSGASNSLILNSHLYVANATGVYLIDQAKARLLLPYNATTPAFISLHASRLDSSRIFGGSINGLSLLKFDPENPGNITTEGIVPGVHEYIRQIVEPVPGTLWLSTYNSGIIRLRYNSIDPAGIIVDRYGPAQNLPVGITSVFQVAGRLVFGTGNGIFLFDEIKQKFLPDPFYETLPLGYNPGECVIRADKDSNIWINAGKETLFYRKMKDGGYRVERGSASRFADDLVYAIYPENQSTVWFGTTNGVISYTAGKNVLPRVAFPAIIRCVKSSGDSILYNGGFGTESHHPGHYKVLYRHNEMTFEFSATSYIKPMDNEFSTMLEGFDQNWSVWNKESKRHYTNLPSGKYIFRVIARNVYGQESTESSFSFAILTPWYSTIGAYVGYTLFFLLTVFGLIRFRTGTLRAQKLTLEKTVKKRTSQIRELSRIGRDITSSLSIENIIHTVYENVNNLMDASVFTIGLYKPEEELLEFPATIQKHQSLPSFSVPLADENNLAIWCFKHRQEVVINDLETEFSKYIEQPPVSMTGENPQSVLYMPLYQKDKGIGVISAQSFSKKAYSDYHLNILRNLATYSAIALVNAEAYIRLSTLLEELKSTQDKLVVQSKLAALGTLTAGIAHEIKNPLNFINNFAGLNENLVKGIQDELTKHKTQITPEAVETIDEFLSTLGQNTRRIIEHGKRADSIVRSMLQHSRGGSGEWQTADINDLLEEAINLTYHGMRAQFANFNVKIEKYLDKSIGKTGMRPQEISRALLNIISNGFYETHRKKLESDGSFTPTLTVKTQKSGKYIKVSVRDNGNGIPEKIREKLFTPFFTTKPAGQGTGLGLSITYDIIVHQHNGKISFETEEGYFTEFIIFLPQ